MSAVLAGGSPIDARIDRLPAARSLWAKVMLISLGGWFEIYDLFFTAYISPGLINSGILKASTPGFFAADGMGAFVAATFGGVFVGTFFLGFLSDRYGRKKVFVWSLIWYSLATAVMAFQVDASGLILWRFIAGIGVGVQVVSMDSYIAEVVPSHMRGRAFALNHVVMFTAVPTVALAAWLLVPIAPFGIEGWRWVVLGGASGALLVLVFERLLPESPRWLAAQGRVDEADHIVTDMESKVRAEIGCELPIPEPVPAQSSQAAEKAGIGELFRPPVRSVFIVLVLFSMLQNFGYYGFAHWVPTLLVAKGILITKSLLYSFVIAFAYPVGPLLAMTFADRIERKWVIVACAFCICVVGIGFYHFTAPALLIACGVAMTLVNTILAYSYHAYQVEVFPTRIRARAAGLSYSASRLAGMFSGFIIAYVLGAHGVGGVFSLISLAMLIVMFIIAVFGPRTGAASPHSR